MKIIVKFLFWLIIFAFIGLLIYQNLDYFMAKTQLEINLNYKDWNWVIPGFENVYYFGGCFLFGFILAGFKGLMVKWRLQCSIKSKDGEIDMLQEKIARLRTELDVYQHDPYIKNGLNKQNESQTEILEIETSNEEEKKEFDKSEIAD